MVVTVRPLQLELRKGDEKTLICTLPPKYLMGLMLLRR